MCPVRKTPGRGKAGERRKVRGTAFRPGSTGACEAQLWEFTGPGENGEGERRVAAASLDQAIGYMRRRHSDFIIVKAELLGMIALLSGSPLN